MAKLKGRQKEFADLQDRPKKEYDPEALDPPSENDDSGSDDYESADEKLATEHYVSVGKSKLRQREPLSLGPKYNGSRVSRAALDSDTDSADAFDATSEDEEDSDDAVEEENDTSETEHDNPEDIGLESDGHGVTDDEEIDSDDALGESDEDRFKDFVFRGSSKPKTKGRAARPKASDFMDSDDSIDDSGNEGEDEEGEDEVLDRDGDVDMDSPDEFGAHLKELDDSEVGEEDDNSDDDEDDESEDDSDNSESDSDGEGVNTGISGIFSNGIQPTVGGAFRRDLKGSVSHLGASGQKELTQGLAFRQQRKTFDSVLNLRVRLQKSLVAVNSFAAVAVEENDEDQQEPYEAAEEAAIKLWNTLDSLRSQMHPEAYAKVNKRKREADVGTSSQEMWDSMAVVEKRAGALRKNNLEKWSERANRGYITSSRDQMKETFKQTLTAALDGQLANPERLVNKTRIPRSCAPIQAAAKKREDASVYDDADFYQMLLKQLLDQRSSDTSGTANGVTTVVWTAQKEAKQKNVVDTKASRGRKMRFNVHEKLQNFMTTEDRRGWEQGAIDRLFGSLFGKKLKLDEEGDSSEDEDDSEGEGGVAVEEGTFRMFAN